MYLDVDIECFRPADDLIKGADTVLQGTIGEIANNFAMAAHSGVHFWEVMIQEVTWRALNVSHADSVLRTTGPPVISDTVCRYVGFSNHSLCWDNIAGTHVVAGQAIRLWPHGSWFSPCWFNDQAVCSTKIKQQQANGNLAYNLTGMHKHLGSWLSKEIMASGDW